MYDTKEEENARAMLPSLKRQVYRKLTPQQLDRYEDFRGARFTASRIERLAKVISEVSSVSSTLPFVLGGVTKLFVGNIVEESRRIMSEWGDSGAIRPEHMREAYRRITTKPTTTVVGKRKHLFRK
jgi:transcription initiation factor TFIID subunit 11